MTFKVLDLCFREKRHNESNGVRLKDLLAKNITRIVLTCMWICYYLTITCNCSYHNLPIHAI